jgi:zinc finger protein 830
VKSEALWPSHLTSKAHRLNYQNYQTSVNSHSETTNGSSSAPTLLKRKPEEMSSENQIGRAGLQEKKVRFDGPSSSEENTHEGSNINPQSKSSLPADFFDDPSQTPTNLDDQSEEKEEEEEEEDPEWKAFEAALQEPTTEDTSANLFAQASLIAEPVLYDSGKPSVSSLDPEIVDDQTLEEQQQEEEEEEDPIEKKIREEKEEIMDRIQK